MLPDNVSFTVITAGRKRDRERIKTEERAFVCGAKSTTCSRT